MEIENKKMDCKQISKDKKKILCGNGFWFLSLTWGILLSLIGFVIGLVLVICGVKPKRIGWFVYFEVGENWGGFELGGLFVVNKGADKELIEHELGHGVQNIMFGMFMIFIVCIPSMVRYWWRRIRRKMGCPEEKLKSYNSFWVERSASELGAKTCEKWGFWEREE